MVQIRLLTLVTRASFVFRFGRRKKCHARSIVRSTTKFYGFMTMSAPINDTRSYFVEFFRVGFNVIYVFIRVMYLYKMCLKWTEKNRLWNFLTSQIFECRTWTEYYVLQISQNWNPYFKMENTEIYGTKIHLNSWTWKFNISWFLLLFLVQIYVLKIMVLTYFDLES